MTDRYENPLGSRYASQKMQELFSPDRKFKTWRLLWIALAETEKELGLPITKEQIEELKAHQSDLDYEAVARHEERTRHDVMAHILAYGEQCPLARPIIHLGATSCYVGDNTDLILMAEGLKLVRSRVLAIMRALAGFAEQYKDLATLGFTHLQPAQPVTVGKRACLWLQDLLLDLEDIDHILGSFHFLGSKGTTGTQASFLTLFDGDQEKVRELDRQVAARMGFASIYPVSGQTYPRKMDSRVVNVLAGLAQSAHKFSNDIRLLQHLKEIEEPFAQDQIGSSAMAYKRNPMRSERIAALARHVICNSLNPAMTAAGQWFERTLDDSANKRLAIPEAFLAIDAILMLYNNIASGLVVYPEQIARRLKEELPFMATENILMAAVKKGGDRQILHEKIRRHSMAAARLIKESGQANDLLARIAADSAFGLDQASLESLLEPQNYIGRSAEQVSEFLDGHVLPLLAGNPESVLEDEIFV